MSNKTNILSVLEINAFKIIKQMGGSTEEFPIDPSMILELNIFESIVAPALTGNFLLKDYVGVKEIGEIFAGDELEISFNALKDDKEKTGEERTMTFIITASGDDRIIPDSTYQTVKYEFTSPWFVEATTRQMSRAFKNKSINDIVASLLKECGVSKLEETITSKVILEQFVSPQWTPLHTIKYLMNWAMSGDDKGGYLLWTGFNHGGVNFLPVSHLFTPGKFSIEPDPALPFMVNPPSIRYMNKIYDQQLESNFDLMRYAEKGMNNKVVYGFDFDHHSTAIVKTSGSVQDYNHEHLSQHMPLPKEYLDPKYQSSSFSSLFPMTAKQVGHTRLVKERLIGKMNTHYSLLFSDIFKLNMMVNPDTSRKAGQLVHVDYQSILQDQNNKLFTGRWIIRDIRHSISGGNYTQFLTLACDGFKELKRTNLVRWT